MATLASGGEREQCAMPTYKGNKGNLLQHWVLCELLSAAREHVSRLQFIDAHAMAPVAEKQEEPLAKLSGVRAQFSISR